MLTEKDNSIKLIQSNDQSDKLKSSMIEMEQKLSQTEIELTNTKTLLDELNQTISLKDDKIVYIFIFTYYLQKSLNETIKTVKEKLTDLTQENEEIKDKLINMTNQVEDNNYTIKQLKEKNENIINNNNNLKLLSETKDCNLLVLKEQIKSLQEKISELSSLNSKKEEQLIKFEKECNSLGDTSRELANSLSYYKTQYENKSNQIETLETSFQTLADDNQTQEELELYVNKIEEIQRTIKERDDQIQILNRSIADLTKECENMKSKNSELSKLVEAKEVQLLFCFYIFLNRKQIDN